MIEHGAAGRPVVVRVRRSGSSRRPGYRRRPQRRRPARRRPARRRTSGLAQVRRRLKKSPWWPAVLIALAVVVGVAWHGQKAAPPPPPPTAQCTILGTTYRLTGEQIANAQTIARVARDRGLPDRAIVIALATAMQESKLRNLPYGDRDSLGLFQQRPSQGWGTPAQVQDPAYAAGKFYDHLVGIPNWQTSDLTLVADAVQRSAFPLAYGRWSTLAERLTTAISKHDYSCP